MRFAVGVVFAVACATPSPNSGTAPPPSATASSVDASLVTTPEADPAPAEAAVAVVADAAPEAAVPPTEAFEITLVRSLCYGVCPSYRVTIRANGTVTYDGDKFVKVHGTVTDHVAPSAARALADRFDAASFDSLKVPTTCALMVTDHPTNVLTYVHDRKKHVVDHYTGNGCAPKALEDLENAVDKLANTERWIRCGKGPQGYCNKP